MQTQSGQDLRKMLEELYLYYFGEARLFFDIKGLTDKDLDAYQKGCFVGGLDAVSAIYLSLFGKKDLMQLWNNTSAKFPEGKTEDDKTTGS